MKVKESYFWDHLVLERPRFSTAYLHWTARHPENTILGQQGPKERIRGHDYIQRENIGYVFQFFNLLQDLTVLENLLLIQELAGSRDEDRARNLLALVGLEGEVDRFPAEISGGQQQRVAIARSLAKRPRLLLGDELTGNLDSWTSSVVMEVLVKACDSEGITCVFVTHDESLVQYATRVIRIDSGKIISDESGGGMPPSTPIHIVG